MTSVQPFAQHAPGSGQGSPPQMHVPFEHSTADPHVRPQPPQLFVSCFVSTHSAPQYVRGAQAASPQTSGPPFVSLQHWPPLHRFQVGNAQLTWQAPQLKRSMLVSTHVSPQHIVPSGQGAPAAQLPGWQVPTTQNEPGAQALPQVPQLAASLRVSTSHPFCTSPSQSAKPQRHATVTHAPSRQVVSPCGIGPQSTPHPPQLFRSLVVSAQRMPQHVNDPGQFAESHGAVHVPLAQSSPAEHRCVHDPHCCGSEAVSISQPFWSTPSQSEKPGRHPPSPQVPATHTESALG
jgi:hypothetical protein